MPSLKWKKEYTAVIFICGISTNFMVAVVNGLLGILHQSAWQGTLSAYYFFLMSLKTALVIGCGKGKENPRTLRRWYLYVSVSILAMEVILGGMVFLMSADQGRKHYPGYLIYGVALYAFCKIIAAVYNMTKAVRYHAPVLLSMKSIGLVDAMVSILMLEIALIDTFGDIHTNWARSMMTASGSAAWVIAGLVGIRGIRWYNESGGQVP